MVYGRRDTSACIEVPVNNALTCSESSVSNILT